MVMRYLAAGMADQPVAGIRAGTVCIWDAGPSGTDYSPMIDPLNHLSKVRFHSDFDYLRIRSIVTSRDPGNSGVNLPFLNNYDNEWTEVTLFAHGLGRVPVFVAQIEANGYHQTVAGSVFPIRFDLGSSWDDRHIIFSADATNVYMLSRGAGSPAMTVHWKVLLLEEYFQTTTNAAHMLRFEAGAATIGQLGKIDPTYRFIRRAAGASGDLRILGRQTILFDTQSNGGDVTVFNYCDGERKLAVPTVQNFDPTPHYNITGLECDVLPAAPDGDTAGFDSSVSGMKIRDAAGNVIFSSDWQMLAVLGRFSGTLTTASHPPTGSMPSRFQTDFDLGAAPTGAQALLGWLNFGTGRNYDFGGTIINGVALPYRRDPSWSFVLAYAQMFSPIISGGRVLLRDDWFSIADNTGAFAGAPKATFSAQNLAYDLRAVALVGGS